MQLPCHVHGVRARERPLEHPPYAFEVHTAKQLARVIYDVEKSVRAGVKEPRPSSIKGQREHAPTERLALKFGLEPGDVFSIRKSSERVNELAKFYGIHVRAVQEIKKADL